MCIRKVRLDSCTFALNCNLTVDASESDTVAIKNTCHNFNFLLRRWFIVVRNHYKHDAFVTLNL